MKKFIVLLYSVLCYGIGLVVIAWYFDFFLGLWVPKYINSEPEVPWQAAIGINLILLTIFGLQHSVMARPHVKSQITKLIPAAAERSTYILLSSLVTVLLIWQWQPIDLVIYDFRNTIFENGIWGLYLLGWAVCLFSTFLINHFDLFGLRQAWTYFEDGEEFTYNFKTPLLYKFIRHPIYLGWLMIHWFTPYMTLGNLVLATGITVYIYIGIFYEEKDLVKTFGQRYIRYKEITPKVLPFSKPVNKNSNEKIKKKVIA
jgi:methanethiol S-methyltransferase